MLKVDQNSVQARPATQERLRPADFGEGRAISQGLENLGRGVGQAAEGIDKIDEIYDTAAVKQADAEDFKKIIEIKGKALSATGFDAQTAVANARQEIADLRKQRLATLKDERQRRMYSDVFDQRGMQIEESFGNHLTKQVAEAEKNAAISRGETYRDAAIDTFGTPAFDDNLGTMLREVASINRGAGSDVIGRAQSQAKSKVFRGAIENMMADPEQVPLAKAALDKHAADLLPEDETELRKRLNPLIEEDEIESAVGWAFTNSAVPGGSDPLAPTEGPDTPPRPSIDTPHAKPAGAAGAPGKGWLPVKGTVTNTAAQHRARGSGNALDVAAPAGTPIHAPMSGKVIKNWWSEEGGWSVLVEHPNGYVTGYAHMRSQSPLREGAAVEPTIPIGSVGQTGTKATGPHVHFTVRQSRAGPKVDPNAINWGNTVKPESVSWKEDPLPKYTPEENAMGRALSRIHAYATEHNWSARKYNDAVTRIRQVSGVQEQLYNQQQEQRWDTALQSVVNLGDKLTSRTQIPGFGSLEPERQLQLDGIIKSNLKGGDDESKANSPYFFEYLRRSYEDRPNFMKSTDYLTDPRITNGERRALYERRLQLTQDPEGHLSSRMDEAMSMANRFLPKEATTEIKSGFMDRYMTAVERRQRDLGKPLDDKDKLDVARALTVSVIRHGPQGDTEGYAFQTIGTKGEKAEVNIPETFNRIPPGRRTEIANLLKSQGRAFSPRAIVEFYLQSAR